MKYFLLIALLGTAVPLMAQADSTANFITLHKDPRIDQLVQKQIEINEVTTREERRFVPGFRILVINTNDRNKAIDAKTRVYKQFPELKSYLMYQSPFFKLKVGNFKEHKDAETYLKDLQRLFSKSVYIVRDIIEVNPDPQAQE